jgi:hypothetical protein
MGTMDSAIAPIVNIKFDIEVALGKRKSDIIVNSFYI